MNRIISFIYKIYKNKQYDLTCWYCSFCTVQDWVATYKFSQDKIKKLTQHPLVYGLKGGYSPNFIYTRVTFDYFNTSKDRNL